MNELREKIEGFWKAFENGHDVGDFVDESCEMTIPGMPPMKGAAAMRSGFDAWRADFHAMRHETLRAAEQGETYFGETRYTARHRGAKPVAWTSADVVVFRNGRIVAWRVYHDPSVLGAQLAP